MHIDLENPLTIPWEVINFSFQPRIPIRTLDIYDAGGIPGCGHVVPAREESGYSAPKCMLACALDEILKDV